MTIFVLGINHKTAPLAVREKAYFANDKITLYLQDILSRGYAKEAVLLSTCNRSELYCNAEDASVLREWFGMQTSLSMDELKGALYIYQDQQAVAHLMTVACGLDSMIMGEPQILGQMKEAFSESCTASAVSSLFHRLFQQVFATAKEIRTTTAIGACPVSVASAAVNFAKQQMPDFSQAQVVMIGAGETTELLMRYLVPQLKKPIILVNRRIDKASLLIEKYTGEALRLDELPEVLKRADIVFSATGSIHPIVTKDMVQSLQKPLTFIDIAVPRDIDPEVATVPNIHLFCIDDLKVMIEKNRQGREHAAEKALEMVRKKSFDFIDEQASLDHVSGTIRAYRGQIEEICRIELAKAKQQLQFGCDPHQVLDVFAHALVRKLLHTPSVQLRQASAEGRVELIHVVKQLFALTDVSETI